MSAPQQHLHQPEASPEEIAAMQAVFDRLDQHLRSGALPSIGSSGNTCWYRHPDDPTRRCFAGVFIPDDEYDPEMEGMNASSLMFGHPDLLPPTPPGFWTKIQDAHDRPATRWSDPDKWRAEARAHLANVADRFGHGRIRFPATAE